MNIKESAYQLYLSGLSYKQISRQLGIGKTTVYDYVKEMKLTHNDSPIYHNDIPVRNGSEPGLNGVRNERSEPDAPENVPEILPEKSRPKIHEFTGDDLIKKRFDCLPFEGKFLELIGKPSKLFSGIIWGLPKGGKSNFAIRFADYLQEYFGKVAYFAAEEGESVTLQEKFKDIGGSRVTIVETRNRDTIREYLKAKDFDFVFIDSINNAGIDNDFLELLKTENPQKILYFYCSSH